MTTTTLRIVVMLALAVLLPREAVADDDFDVKLDAPQFGSFSQQDMVFSANGCGPAATVNSMTYLQNRFKSWYRFRLVPDGKRTEVANKLAGVGYMKTDPNSGTTLSNLISGKRKYFAEVAADAPTEIFGEDFAATLVTAGATLRGPPVSEHVEKLLAALRRGADVELFLSMAGPNHYITLVGLRGSTDAIGATAGMLMYVDPRDGKLHETPFQTLPGSNPLILLKYKDPLTDIVKDATITGYAGEVASPSGTAVLILGLCAGARRRRV